MKKHINSKLLLIAFLAFLPFKASAATVYLEASRPSISVGDTVIVSVKINAEGTTINTVEGDVALTSGVSNVAVKEFSLANSAFGLWPRTPSLSSDNSDISFVGGVPGGFNIEGATLFKIIVEAKKAGTLNLAPQNIAVYANDGKGTKLPVKVGNLSIKISPQVAGVPANDEWNTIVAKDTVAPENFIIVLGQDKTLFDNKKFAFFSALDNQSGISYYDVSENGAPAVRSGSTYILQNQTGDVSLVVTAYDKAGNRKTAVYSSKSAISTFFIGVNWSAVIIVLLIIIIIVLIYRQQKKNKNNAPTTVQ